VAFFSNASAQTKHRYLIGDYFGFVAIVNEDGATAWKFSTAGEISDAWLLPNGNVVFAYETGVKVVKPDYTTWTNTATVWNRLARTGGEIHSCQPLDGGSSKFLISESIQDSTYILEVDTANKVSSRLGLRLGGSAHGQLRQMRKTAQRTYLVPTFAGSTFEYDTTGKLLRTFPSAGFSVVRLANGNTVVSSVSNGIIEFDTSKTPAIVWQLSTGSQITNVPAGMTISFGITTGVTSLSNGNLVFCNYDESGGQSGPAILEVNHNKQLVWHSVSDFNKSVESIQILDNLTATLIPVSKERLFEMNRIGLSAQQRFARFTVIDLLGRAQNIQKVNRCPGKVIIEATGQQPRMSTDAGK